MFATDINYDQDVTVTEAYAATNDVEASLICPACGSGHHVLLGQLGHLTHFSCRDCGSQYSADSSDVEEGV